MTLRKLHSNVDFNGEGEIPHHLFEFLETENRFLE